MSSDTLQEFRIAVQDAAYGVISGAWSLREFYAFKTSSALQYDVPFLEFARHVGQKLDQLEGRV